jgi:aldose 1-epimerase
MSLTRAGFGSTPAGDPVMLFTCSNRNGLVLELISYGAAVKSMAVPDRHGTVEVITLGFPDLAGYLQRHPYFGSTVGRFVNRIAGARFTLDGVTYRLAANDGPNHLHGGATGFDRVVWDPEPFEGDGRTGVRFRYVSPDGEEGYPGRLAVEATYELSDADELTMSYRAKSDAPTPVNLANHTYWNLAGRGTILDHEVEIEADHYLPVDATQIPTGEVAPVAGTAMDFTSAKPVGRDLEDVPGDRVGYDFCYVLRHRSRLARAAVVTEPASGRVMEVSTTQPGIQFYSGNKLTGFEPSGGYRRHAGLCLETQHFPDSPNQPQFPSTVLAPGEEYAHVTVHRFSTA